MFPQKWNKRMILLFMMDSRKRIVASLSTCILFNHHILYIISPKRFRDIQQQQMFIWYIFIDMHNYIIPYVCKMNAIYRRQSLTNVTNEWPSHYKNSNGHVRVCHIEGHAVLWNDRKILIFSVLKFFQLCQQFGTVLLDYCKTVYRCHRTHDQDHSYLCNFHNITLYGYIWYWILER